MDRNIYTSVRAKGKKNLICVKARIEIRRATPMIATSRRFQNQSLAWDFRF